MNRGRFRFGPIATCYRLDVDCFFWMVGVGENWWPQSQVNRRAGTWRLHFGHGLDQLFRLAGFFTSWPAALRASRERASARVTAHWGWTPVNEYDGLPQTGQGARVGVTWMGTGFLSLMFP